MNSIRERARRLRFKREAGELHSREEAVASCVTFAEALTVFDGPVREDDEASYPSCCGAEVACQSGFLFGAIARCETCGAEIRDALGIFSSPFLERGNSWVTAPSEEMCEAFGESHWFVVHEGDRGDES